MLQVCPVERVWRDYSEISVRNVPKSLGFDAGDVLRRVSSFPVQNAAILLQSLVCLSLKRVSLTTLFLREFTSFLRVDHYDGVLLKNI